MIKQTINLDGKSQMTYAAVIPLVGGFPLGFMNHTGRLPEWIASYPDTFGANDRHFINYVTEHGFDGPVYDIEETTNVLKNVDVVCNTSPCAGLSMLNVHSSSDSAVNEWMLKSSEWTLSVAKPKIMIGENAPALATQKGEKFLKRLIEVGERNGYSMSLYKTSSCLHGSNQYRARSYFMFTRGAAVKIPKFFTPPDVFENYAFDPTSSDDPMNVQINKNNCYDDLWARTALDVKGVSTFSDFYDSVDITTNTKLFSTNPEYIDTLRKHVKDFPKDVEKVERIYNKLANKEGGIWTHGAPLVVRTDGPKNTYGTFVAGMYNGMINHKQNRFITFREGLRAMDFPEDFNLIDMSNPNVISQNVCVNVSTDMANACEQILGGYGQTNEQLVITYNHELEKEIKSKSIDLF